jgi:hypothetical protein
MAKREVEEADFLASQELVKLFADMLNNPDARKHVLTGKKIVRPNESIPEFDAAAPLRKEIDDLRKVMADDKKAREDAIAKADTDRKNAELHANWNKQKQGLRDAGWLAEGIEKVEKLAFDRGIPDLDAAAALYEKLNPPAAPSEPVGRGFWENFGAPTDEDGDMKKLLDSRGQSEGLLNKMIGDALREVRGGQRRN